MRLAASLAALCLLASPVLAGEAWDDLKPLVFDDRVIEDGAGIVALHAPYRAKDERSVPITVDAAFSDGRKVKAVTLIIDENPMPVSASFRFENGQDAVSVGANFRFNGPSPLRAIVEADDGRLYMAEAPVKTIGLGACASPPVKSSNEAIASMGEMKLEDSIAHGAARQSGALHVANLEVSHPNLTGLQKDQITLLYIPARYVDTFDVWQGEEKLMTVEGGISIAEDPKLSFSYRDNGAGKLKIRIEDTKGASFEKVFDVSPQS